ncbi:DUF234 domain-containing protein [Streptomyces sp. NBC_01336]|uniref:DUF234 domain-containing protein n=1 Tax=Streptomyces sp. NBC_01336 TaxID=2903829 RepID=UPI003FCD5072
MADHRAIEPVIREALWRLGSDDGQLPGGTDAIGGYWTRTNDPEIDIVGADRAPIAKKITLVGSVKWLEKKPFDNRDLARLVTHRSQLPGADDTTPCSPSPATAAPPTSPPSRPRTSMAPGPESVTSRATTCRSER